MSEMGVTYGMHPDEFKGWATLAERPEPAAHEVPQAEPEHGLAELPPELRGDLLATLRSGEVVQRTHEAARARVDSAWNPISRFFAKRALAQAEGALKANDTHIAELSTRLLPVQQGPQD